MYEPNLDRRTVLQAMGGVAAVGLSTTLAAAHRGGLKGELAEVRSATASYNNSENAYDDGYVVPDETGDPIPLEDVPEEGHAVCGMGFHFINESHLGSTDRTVPQVLAYGLGDDGDLVLGAVEYVVPKRGEYESSPPDLFTHDDGSEQWQEDSPFPGVWSLHVWVHNKNPDGVFAPFNPREIFKPAGCDHPHEH